MPSSRSAAVSSRTATGTPFQRPRMSRQPPSWLAAPNRVAHPSPDCTDATARDPANRTMSVAPHGARSASPRRLMHGTNAKARPTHRAGADRDERTRPTPESGFEHAADRQPSPPRQRADYPLGERRRFHRTQRRPASSFASLTLPGVSEPQRPLKSSPRTRFSSAVARL